MRGNPVFFDDGKRNLLQPYFHPRRGGTAGVFLSLVRREFGLGDLFKIKRENDYTFGALFQTR